MSINQRLKVYREIAKAAEILGLWETYKVYSTRWASLKKETQKIYATQ